MDDVAASKNLWSLERSMGMLHGGTLAAHVDVSQPNVGLRDLKLKGHGIAGRWFCVSRESDSLPWPAPPIHDESSWPLAVADTYVRGADLVASYLSVRDWPYSPQIYWRAGPLDAVESVLGSLSLLVSVQTHLLETHPRIVVDSIVHAPDAFRLTANVGKSTYSTSDERECDIQAAAGVHCVVRRFTGAPLSYAEFMPASDFQSVRTQRDDEGNCRVQWELFAEFLEKGVIRRARVHGAFLRRENDKETAAACCEAIERDSLPLTT